MSHNPDFDFETSPGLPQELPKGETLLWQGAPDALGLALDALHIRWVAAGLAPLVLWRALTGWHDGETMRAVAVSVGGTVLFMAAALGILALAAYLMARGTVYSVTTKRIVIRHGVAMPMTINIPFGKIDSAAVRAAPNSILPQTFTSRLRPDLTNISFQMAEKSRASYIALWPHVRPLAFRRPEPLLRAIADGEHVSRLIAGALAETLADTRADTATDAATGAVASQQAQVVVRLPTMGKAGKSTKLPNRMSNKPATVS
jgi:Bacterial PH domain